LTTAGNMSLSSRSFIHSTVITSERRLLDCVLLLVYDDDVYGAHVNDLENCTGIANWEAAVRYKRVAAERQSGHPQ